jgi:TRAP-type transport system periplasmic protein
MRRMAMLALLCALPPLEGAATTNLLRIGAPWPAGSKGMVDLQAAGRDIARKTDGRVQVKFAEQQDLDSGPLPCDGALLAGPGLARQSPASLVFALPLFFRSSAEVARLRAQMDAAIAAELEGRGFATLAQLDLGFAYLHSVLPVETPAALKASKLWVPPAEPEAVRMAESYGMTPVPLEAAQVRDALRQGTVEAAIVPPLGAILLQWHTEIKSVADTPFACLYAAVAVKRDALDRLEPPDRVLVCAELARAFAAAADELRAKEAEAFDVLVQNGVERHSLGALPEQRAEWEAWAVAVANRLSAAGILSASVLDRARKTLSEFRAAP